MHMVNARERLSVMEKTARGREWEWMGVLF